MSLSQQEMAELEELCGALLDGRSTPAQQARLSQWLTQSEDARRYYVHCCGLSASLQEHFGAGLLADVRPAGTQLVAGKNSWRDWRRGIKWAVGMAALAATILAAVWLGTRAGHEDLPSMADLEREYSAAQITGLQDCQWLEPADAMQTGDTLHSGQRLQLAAGMAEITFDCGAEITVEGPAALEVNSAWGATLSSGKLTARVPHEAIGFRAATSTVDVVDLGTEFCMLVNPDGATDVGVLKGAVQATPVGTNEAESSPVVLQQAHAQRFRRQKNEEIEDPATVFARFNKPTKMKRLARVPNYVHWSFDDSEDYTVHADYHGPAAKVSDMILESDQANKSSVPVASRWGNALAFDGHLSAHATVPGLSNHAPHTIAFWMKMPPDASLSSAGSMIAWITTSANEVELQSAAIDLNTNPELGPLGALRTKVARICAVGTTNLRDGQWHHVAIELAPRKHWQIKQYIDGHLEQETVKTVKQRRVTGVESADDTLWLGQQPGQSRSEQRFQGDLDELFISDRQLTPQQISQLFQQNQLSAASATASAIEEQTP